MTNSNKPPLIAANTHWGDGQMIFLRQGVDGYFPKESLGIVDDTMTAEQWNTAHGITQGEANALMIGSMFGWDYAEADPDHWNADGTQKRNH